MIIFAKSIRKIVEYVSGLIQANLLQLDPPALPVWVLFLPTFVNVTFDLCVFYLGSVKWYKAIEWDDGNCQGSANYKTLPS